MSERPPLSARAEKAVRLAVGGALSLIPGLIALATDQEWLGYVCVGVLLLTILAGPVIEHFGPDRT